MSNDISKYFGSEMDRYPINKPPQVVYGNGGKVLGYYMQDSLGNTQYIEVKNKKDVKELREIQEKVEDQKEVEEEVVQDSEEMDGLTLYFFKDHSLFQLMNMLNSGKFKHVEFQIKLAISMYDMLNKYLDSKGKDVKF